MPNFVQQYRSTDTGAPVLTGQVGSLITLLDAILVNGYSTIAITSVSRSGTTATAIIAANTTLLTGQWVVIANFNEAGYNGTVQITVNSSTSISWQVSSGTATPGTGSGTYKKAGLGWTKPFSATNFGAYLPQSGLGFPQHYYRVSDNGLSTGGAKEACVLGYETMSDVNTGTGKFPTTVLVPLTGTEAQGGTFWRKSLTADATARPWTLFGDGATFYLFVNSDAGSSTRFFNGCGAYQSYTAADAYNSVCGGVATTNSASAAGAAGLSYDYGPGASGGTGAYSPRAYSQTGGAVVIQRFNPFCHATPGVTGKSTGGLNYPNGPDGALWVAPIFLLDAPPASARGRLRGIYGHCHTTIPFNEYDIATNVAGLSGVTLTAVTVGAGNNQGLTLIDTYGPW